MSRSRIALIVALAAAIAAGDDARAQMPPISALEGEVGLGLLLRQLKTTAVLMQATAHPDDENSAMLAAMGWGQGARTVVATATRGDGGQNEIGPELFDALAMLRTEELISVHQLDSAEQYFTRAVDFGYSFSIDETFEKWGRQEILGDFVRLIRTVRPDVIIAMRPDGTGGGQHHQASALLAREAFLAAADPAKFPEQIREGLRPWQPRKFYYTGRFGFPGEPAPPAGVKLTAVDTGAYDPLLGESYAEIGSRARSNHKTQGMAQLLTLPGPSSAGYQLVESAIPGLKEKGDASLFPDAPFGLPFRPTPFRAQFDLEIGGAAIPVERDVQHRYEGNIFSGEKRMELQVVPSLAVSLTPDIAIVPRTPGTAAAGGAGAARAAGRELRVTVINGNKGPAEGEVSLEVPAGWIVRPPSAKVSLAREDESEPARFTVTPPPGSKPGSYGVKAVVTAGADRFASGYQVVEYPHTRRRHLLASAEATLEVVDVAIAPRLEIGYVMGVGDQVPPAIEQLGARVTLLDADGLAFGDLSKFDAIVTGVRAYERRPDLRANNQRLLEYAQKGGTVIVQYNKFEFNEAQYGPFPAKVSSNRVTDEHAPVQVLVPDHPVMRWPNRIGDATWANWVQERGLYFLGEKDAKYVDLVQLEDPFPFNKGPKRGALVEAQVGKGRWLYVGLGLWRQLPAGTEGAYQLLANLLSVGKAPRVAAPPRK
jgi:LmbE family N-acetylglucosaminyl deacetylase